VAYYKRITHHKEINHLQKIKEIHHQLRVMQAMPGGSGARTEADGPRFARRAGLHACRREAELVRYGDGPVRERGDGDLVGMIDRPDESIAELQHIARNRMLKRLLRPGLEEALRVLCAYDTCTIRSIFTGWYRS
jgi:hypothetical protein